MAKESINTQKGRLYLLCRLPPRNDQKGAVWQQRVALGLDDTPTNRKVAERRRVELQRQVDRGTLLGRTGLNLLKALPGAKRSICCIARV